MTFWDLVWAVLKLGVFIYIGVPVIGIILLLIICLFL